MFNTYFSNNVASPNIPSVNNNITAKENANKDPQQIKCFERHSYITVNSTEHLLLVLMKLRLGLLHTDLAFRFGLELSDVSRIYSTWVYHEQ